MGGWSDGDGDGDVEWDGCSDNPGHKRGPDRPKPLHWDLLTSQ